MKKFEIGKEYFDTSACDHNCVFTIKIVKRTDKTVTFERNGKTRRTKLFSDERGEYIIPYVAVTCKASGSSPKFRFPNWTKYRRAFLSFKFFCFGSDS